jgi:septal ring factor EnvC (AmiA/AmiB activator)
MLNLDQNNWPRMAALAVAAYALCAAMPAAAQDVRGLEVCTAEKQMDRRTGCLQANTEFLQSLIERNARDARLKLDAAAKELAAARNEITALKAALTAATARLEKLEKAEKTKDNQQPKPK